MWLRNSFEPPVKETNVKEAELKHSSDEIPLCSYASGFNERSQESKEKIAGKKDESTTQLKLHSLEPDNTDKFQRKMRVKSLLRALRHKEYDVKQLKQRWARKTSKCGSESAQSSNMDEDDVKPKQETETAEGKNGGRPVLVYNDDYCNPKQPKQQETIRRRKHTAQSVCDSRSGQEVEEPNKTAARRKTGTESALAPRDDYFDVGQRKEKQKKREEIIESRAKGIYNWSQLGSHFQSSECLKTRAQHELLQHTGIKKHPSSRCSTATILNQSIPSADGPLCPDCHLPVSICYSRRIIKQDASGFSKGSESMRSHGQPGEATLQSISVHTSPGSSYHQLSNTIPWMCGSSHKASVSKITHAKSSITQAGCFNQFTPVITPDFDDETYRFQFFCPGLYQCSVTGLVFNMKGEGEVVYRTVPWNRRLLGQHHKKPAGPLFDISCVQQSVFQLHLPHCEILGGQFLSVAHVNDEGIEFISPHKVTETHVVINITGFSGFGNVKDEDSPPDPVRALVLLFYKPPAHSGLTSFINVLLVPRNIVIRDVQRTRRKLIGDETFIDTYPHCKLRPQQVYTLTTRPQDHSVKIQPAEVEFDDESHSSYFTSIQVILRSVFRNIELTLKDKTSCLTVWESEVFLPFVTPPATDGGSVSLSAQHLSATQRLLDIRRSFICTISEPNLKDLLDRLLERNVITDSERESLDEIQSRRDKARSVINTVRTKGEVSSSQMIEILRVVDPFLCEHLGLR